MSKTTAEQTQNFARLDSTMQAIATSFIEDSSSFNDLTHLMKVEGLSIKQHMDQHFQQLEVARLDEAFLDTLRFPDIICGRRNIKDAYRKTFQWIFRPPESF